ncbi:DNA primase family protein [Streptococcus anginosus]|uniref:Virulence-associated protein E n=3 Tax=root TaxID=1 RepID=W1TR02_STRAP|nr:phage/plasmid primase, P4 family [Streptococcus anginosus]ETI83936.1 MAG: Virulence-associated protein E [Streptococcus anginosus DORA_7]QBX12316.1 DNA primase [Streptococcus satellite phage Javan70]HEO4828599.1 DNA primase [Streptococcus agalactiae]MCW1018877.1 phage/plasmid primase, P4 family [Streptococcus anginosus]MCW1085450.1 phage/plasmid primase, P4 family [Streptococcus anginosus]
MKILESEILEVRESEDKYFKTFKSVRGQLIKECQSIKEEAYQIAYNEVMADSKHLENVKAGRLTEKQHKELAHQKGQEASEKALPKTPLGVAIMLKQYIRFIRIKPEAQGQKAPLYYYNPDFGIWLEDNELLQDLISTIFPNATEKQAFDTLYKIARQSQMKEIQGKYTVIGKQLYNAETGLFEEITPEIIVTRKIKTGYNPNTKEPNLKGWKPTTWLKELFDHDEELYNLAIQIIKASITGQSLQKIFWLYGEGGTGKGTFQQLLINLIGMENVASLKITGLSNSRFSASILLGKSLVIGDDVQKDAVIKDTSDMFSLATGDIMTIEDKGKRPYSIRLNMTVVQSSNGLPRMNGDKSAIDRRFRILPFTKIFKDKPNKAIKEDYINRKEVLEYLVKLAIETPIADINPRKSIEILEEHHKEMNPVIDFISKFFTDELTSEFIPNSFVYHVWKGFLEYYDIKQTKSERGLHKEIKNNLPEGFETGMKIIPSGQQLHKGFFPKEDLPPYASLAYSNGRTSPEKQKKPKNERGYYNHWPEYKKRRKK